MDVDQSSDGSSPPDNRSRVVGVHAAADPKPRRVSVWIGEGGSSGGAHVSIDYRVRVRIVHGIGGQDGKALSEAKLHCGQVTRTLRGSSFGALGHEYQCHQTEAKNESWLLETQHDLPEK